MQSERLGRYELVRHLASGGMSQVYLARLDGAAGFARHVVLKTVRPEAYQDPSLATMFLDEARLIAMLHHQHVAQVFECGITEDGTYFLAMEYLHGETVRAVLDRAHARGRRLPLDFALTVVVAAAHGLHHAHEQRTAAGNPLGIVHRDVTPANLIVGYDGSVKLIDFGMAKAAERSLRTQTGVIKGKPGYMAPEQVLSRPVDRRTDVFALGILLYELTTQSHPFGNGNEVEMARRIADGVLVSPSKRRGGYPPELEAVALTALQHDPEARFADADAMRAAIERTAGLLGMSLGCFTVSRVLVDLFGRRLEPWRVHAPTDEGTDDDTTTLRWMALDSGPSQAAQLPDAPPSSPTAVFDDLPDAAEALRAPPREVPLDPGAVYRIGRIAAAIAAAVLAIGGIALVARGTEAGSVTAGLEPIEIVTPAPARPPPQRPPPRTSRPAAIRPPPRGELVFIQVTTEPDNATVLLDGVRLGRSPLMVTVSRDQRQATLKVRKHGYKSKRRVVSLEKDVSWDIGLSRRR